MSTLKADSIQPTNSGNNLIFKTGVGDAERMRIDTSGNVGIGTAPTSYKLTVGGSSPQFSIIDSGANLSRALITVTPGGVSFGNTYSSTAIPLAFNIGVTEVARFNTSGNFGIGTASPAVSLDVTGEARSSTSTTSSSDAKTLTTKDYVDYVSQTKIDEYLEYTNNNSGSFLQIPVSTFQVGKLYALKLKTTVSPGSGANFSIIGTPITTATAESSTTIPGEGIMVLATYSEFNSTNNVVSQSVGGPQFYGMVLEAIGATNKPANVIANFGASCSNNNSTAVTWVLLRRLW